MANGFGSVLNASISRYALQAFGSFGAFHLLTVLSLPLSLICTLMLESPPPPKTDTSENDIVETHYSKPVGTLSLSSLFYTPKFWVYSFIVFSSQVSYPFFSGYFSIGDSFGVSTESLASSFQKTFLVSTLLRPVGGYLMDLCSWGSGRFSVGSRNVLFLSLLTEALLLLEMVSASYLEDFSRMQMALAGMFLMYPLVCSCAPVLARDIFGSENSATVFGVGGSCALGAGAFSSLASLSLVSGAIPGVKPRPIAFVSIYTLFVLTAFAGLITCLTLQKFSFVNEEETHPAGKGLANCEENITVSEPKLQGSHHRCYGSMELSCSSHILKIIDHGKGMEVGCAV